MAELEREAEAQATEEPVAKAHCNFTDPESRIMKSGEGAFRQDYNAQAAVDSDHQIIVAADLSTQAADSVHLVPMWIASDATWAATPSRSRPMLATAQMRTWRSSVAVVSTPTARSYERQDQRAD